MEQRRLTSHGPAEQRRHEVRRIVGDLGFGAGAYLAAEEGRWAAVDAIDRAGCLRPSATTRGAPAPRITTPRWAVGTVVGIVRSLIARAPKHDIEPARPEARRESAGSVCNAR